MHVGYTTHVMYFCTVLQDNILPSLHNYDGCDNELWLILNTILNKVVPLLANHTYLNIFPVMRAGTALRMAWSQAPYVCFLNLCRFSADYSTTVKTL